MVWYDIITGTVLEFVTLKWKEWNVSESLKKPPPFITQQALEQQFDLPKRGFLATPSLSSNPCDTFLNFDFMSESESCDQRLTQNDAPPSDWRLGEVTQSPSDISTGRYCRPMLLLDISLSQKYCITLGLYAKQF